MDLDAYAKLCKDPKYGGRLASVVLPRLRDFFVDKQSRKPPVIWLETTGCSGNSVSLWNAVGPDLGQILEDMIDLRYWNFLMAAQDDRAIELLHTAAAREKGRFILVVEGAIALNEKYTVVHRQAGQDHTALEMVRLLGRTARHVMAVGTCASFGGLSAARPNPSRSVSVEEAIKRKVIKASGCPANPDWIIGTLGHLLMFGEPELEEHGRPRMFYGETVHRRCTRRSFFEQGIFAKSLGDPECMLRLGCKGPVTAADCPTRQWNSYVSWPVEANTPCIGCTNPGFPDQMEPFFEPLRPTRLMERLRRNRSSLPGGGDQQ